MDSKPPAQAVQDGQPALLSDLPRNCLYFTLPDVAYLPRNTKALRIARNNSSYFVSNIAPQGPSNKMFDATAADFLLQLLNPSEWEPDFAAVGEECKITNPEYTSVFTLRACHLIAALIWCSNRRPKTFVESKGYGLEDDYKISDSNDPPELPRAGIPVSNAGKKRKAGEAADDTFTASKDRKASKARKSGSLSMSLPRNLP